METLYAKRLFYGHSEVRIDAGDPRVVDTKAIRDAIQHYCDEMTVKIFWRDLPDAGSVAAIRMHVAEIPAELGLS